MDPANPPDVLAALLTKAPELVALLWIVNKFLSTQKDRDALFTITITQLAEQGRAVTTAAKDAIERNTAALNAFTQHTTIATHNQE